jgi:hypothetical protein
MKNQISILVLLLSLSFAAFAQEGSFNCYNNGDYARVNDREIVMSGHSATFVGNIKSFFEKRLKAKSLKSVSISLVTLTASKELVTCEKDPENKLSCLGHVKDITLEMKAFYQDENSSGSYSLFTTVPVDNFSVTSSSLDQSKFNLQTVADINLEGEPVRIKMVQLYELKGTCRP